MKNKYRTIYCGEVSTKNIGEEIKVAGWLEQKRNLGSLVFMTLRDETGVIQLISEDIDIIAPSCGLAPKTPLANVKALVEARNEYFNI